MTDDFDPEWFSGSAPEVVAPAQCEKVRDAEDEARRLIVGALHKVESGYTKPGSRVRGQLPRFDQEDLAAATRSEASSGQSQHEVVNRALLAFSRVIRDVVPNHPDREKALNTLRMTRLEAYELITAPGTALSRRDPYRDVTDAQSTEAMRITVVANLLRRARMWAFEALRLGSGEPNKRTVLTVPEEVPASKKATRKTGQSGPTERDPFIDGIMQRPPYAPGTMQPLHQPHQSPAATDEAWRHSRARAGSFAILAYAEDGSPRKDVMPIHLDASGDDERGDGSPERPFRTLPRALQEAERRTVEADRKTPQRKRRS